jgi:hypothetical protein
MQSLASIKGNLVNFICDIVVIITSKIHKDANGIKQKAKHCKQTIFIARTTLKALAKMVKYNFSLV